MDRQARFEAFKALHEAPGAFVIPNPWDAGSTRILTSLGFQALATTSAGYAFATGRRSSFASLNRDEVLENCRQIVEATHLPVSADLEEGFGPTPEDCAATIRGGAGVGLVGGSIEDATGDKSDPIFGFELSVARITAAAEAAHNNDFLLTARAEGFLWGQRDLGEVIRRLNAFSEAGADVLYAPGLPGIDAIAEVCRSVDKPVNVVMGLMGVPLSVPELAAVGVKRVSVGGSFARAAWGGMMRAALEVRDHGTFTYAADAIPDAEISAMMSEDKRD